MRVKHLMVSYETFNNYLNENKTDRIDKFLKIYTYKEFRISLFESFDKKYKPNEVVTKYKFDKKFSNYDTDGYKIFFKTDSDNKYRIDLIPMMNGNDKIDSEFVWNISFTTSDNSEDSIWYETVTSFDETREVLLRIGDILDRINIPKYFVIGNTALEKKIKLYQNFIVLVFPKYKIEMSYCKGFKDDKGLYIWN